MKGHLKILVKVHNSKDWVWRHFCYVPTDLVAEYEKSGSKLSDAIIKWAKEDTGISICSLDTLKTAKNNIKALYKEKYPDMYLEGETDSQGWARLWVIEHIKEEINHG